MFYIRGYMNKRRLCFIQLSSSVARIQLVSVLKGSCYTHFNVIFMWEEGRVKVVTMFPKELSLEQTSWSSLSILCHFFSLALVEVLWQSCNTGKDSCRAFSQHSVGWPGWLEASAAGTVPLAYGTPVENHRTSCYSTAVIHGKSKEL